MQLTLTNLFAEENAPPVKDLDEQYTPLNVFQKYHEEFQFTLDPCATAESAKLPRFFTKEQNGLKQSWCGERVWLNPPYSRLNRWLTKARHEMAHGCLLVVALLPAWTDRVWWHTHIEPFRGQPGLDLRFHKGRIRFGCPGNPHGKGRDTGKFPSVFVIWS